MSKGNFEEEAVKRMREDGFDINLGQVKLDRKFHRSGRRDKPQDKDCAYCGCTIGDIKWIYWKNHSTGKEGKLYSRNPEDLKPRARKRFFEEEEKYINEFQKNAENDKVKRARKIWKESEELKDGEDNHFYLRNKNIHSHGLRLSSSKKLLIPGFDENGELRFIQRIYKAEGEVVKRNLGPSKGAFFIIKPSDKDEESPIYIAEGYATGASIHEATGSETWIAFSADNLKSTAQNARFRYKSRKIVICADYDEPNEQFTEPGGKGVAKANEAAQVIGNCYVAICPNVTGVKTDFNDLASHNGPKKVRKVLEKVLAGEPQNLCAIPEGFKLIKTGKNAGLYKVSSDENNEEKLIRLGPPLEGVALTKSVGQDWSLEVAFRDPDGKKINIIIPQECIHGERPLWRSLLARKGWRPEPGDYRHTHNYLSLLNPDTHILIVDRVGWLTDHSFVSPDAIYGSVGDEQIKTNLDEMVKSFYTSSGLFKKWKQMTVLCIGNPYMMFGVAVGFAGTLLRFSKLESGGFLLDGMSGIGKSTILMICVSVWGKPDKHHALHSFHTSPNALENVVAAHNDGSYVLDEISQVKASDLETIIYMLGNGIGKSRNNSESKHIETLKWNNIFLASGEESLATKLLDACKAKRTGEEARFTGIHLTKEHIKNLHGYEDSASLINQIRAIVEDNYGLAGKKFLEKITQPEMIEEIKRELPTFIRELRYKLNNANEGIVDRVASRFALIAYAAKLAVSYGILPEEFANTDYIETCFNNWFTNYGPGTLNQEDQILDRICNILKDNKSQRFIDIRDFENYDKVFLQQAWGYTGYDKKGCKPEDLIFLPHVFSQIVCDGCNEKLVKNILNERKMLRHDQENLNFMRISLPVLGQKKVYVITLDKDA